VNMCLTVTGQYKEVAYKIDPFDTKLDVHESVHRDKIVRITNKMHYVD